MGKIKKFPLEVIIHLTHAEYQEEIIHAIKDLQNVNNQIEEIFYSPEAPLIIQAKINVYASNRDYRTFIIFNHWAHKYTEAIEEIEIIANKPLFKIHAKDITHHQQQEDQHLSLHGSPKTSQPKEFAKTVAINQHIISRDGDICSYCSSKLNPNTMKNIKVIKELYIDDDEKFVSDIHKQDFSVGICSFCAFAKSGEQIQSLTLKQINTRDLKINFSQIQKRLEHINSKYPQYEDEVQLAYIYLQALKTNNPELLATYSKETKQVKYQRNRRVKRNTDKQFTRSLKRLQPLLKRDKTTVCCWCSKDFHIYNRPTIDHLVPRSLGGPNNNANYVVACNDCNNERANLLVYKWLDRCFTKGYQPNLEAILLRLTELTEVDSISDIAHKDLDRVLVYHLIK